MNVFLIALTGMLIILEISIRQKRTALVRLHTISKRRI
jgi:hypothetical protein